MSSLRRNSLWLLLARLTAQGLALLFVAVIARRLGVAGFGQFTFIGAVVLIGNTFTNFGTDTYVIREVARTRAANPLLANALALQLALSAGWWIITLTLQPGPPLLLYSLALFPLALYSVLSAALRAFERMDLVWSLSLANGLVQILAALLATDLWTLCVYLLLGQVITAALTFWICHAFLPRFRLFPFQDFLPLLKRTLPFATLTLMIVLSQRLGVLSVSHLLGDSATGLFSSVARIVDGLKLGHYAVLGALLPMIARAITESKQSFRSGFVLLVVLSSIMALGLSIFGRWILAVLYGPAYVSGVSLLALLGWSLIPYTVSSFIAYDLIARGRERDLVKATALSLTGFFLMYATLVPAFGLHGAVYAALFGEIAQAAIFTLIRMKVISGSRRSHLAADPDAGIAARREIELQIENRSS